MGERTRKRPRERKDTASIMEPGGEGFIYDPSFKIKLGTYPILKGFKTRSYLNFMASLPMKKNPATGYFEFAETAEEVTALARAYFYASEPIALADSGYDKFRINKARHLLAQTTLNTTREGTGYNNNAIGDTFGVQQVHEAGPYPPMITLIPWDAEVLGAPGNSPSSFVGTSRYLSILLNVSAATTITVQVSDDNIHWYDHTEIVFPAAGTAAQQVMVTQEYMRFHTSAAATITAKILCMDYKFVTPMIISSEEVTYSFLKGDNYFIYPAGILANTIGEIALELNTTTPPDTPDNCQTIGLWDVATGAFTAYSWIDGVGWLGTGDTPLVEGDLIKVFGEKNFTWTPLIP